MNFKRLLLALAALAVASVLVFGYRWSNGLPKPYLRSDVSIDVVAIPPDIQFQQVVDTGFTESENIFQPRLAIYDNQFDVTLTKPVGLQSYFAYQGNKPTEWFVHWGGGVSTVFELYTVPLGYCLRFTYKDFSSDSTVVNRLYLLHDPQRGYMAGIQ